MAIIVLKNKPTKADLKKAREDYPNYIKITADIEQEIVLIGGEYHADAERILIEEHRSKQKDIWGGGYNLSTGQFETIALINMRPFHKNSSQEILDPEIRKLFLKIAKQRLGNIKSLYELSTNSS